MRRKLEQISKSETKLVLTAFNSAAKTFSGKDATVRFADSVLTESEKVIIGRRILIARMILSGHTYYEVNNRLKISPNTFSKVRKWLDEQLPGYESVLKEEKLREKLKNASKKEKQVDPTSLAGLKKKYPLHFLLLNIFGELRK